VKILSLLILLLLALCSCSSVGSSSGGGGSSSTDYRFLYDHNANVHGGYTVRWGSNTIKVYTAGIPGAEEAVNRWVGPVNFSFVSSPPSDGISFSWTSSGNFCGIATTFYLESGQISQSQVQIHTNQNSCRGGLDNTLSHETAHALGFFGHTADGGLMDPDGGNSNITTPVRNFMTLLYSRPYGWNINPFLSLKTNLTASPYKANGTRTLVRVDY